MNGCFFSSFVILSKDGLRTISIISAAPPVTLLTLLVLMFQLVLSYYHSRLIRLPPVIPVQSLTDRELVGSACS